MPATGGYLVSPRRMAAIAASLMLSGVSKSGSPAPSPITSRPASFSSRAFCVTAMVADGLTRARLSARKLIKCSGRFSVVGKTAADPIAAASPSQVRSAKEIPISSALCASPDHPPFPQASTRQMSVAKAIHLTLSARRGKSRLHEEQGPMLTLYSQQASGNAYKPRLLTGAARHSVPSRRHEHL